MQFFIHDRAKQNRYIPERTRRVLPVSRAGAFSVKVRNRKFQSSIYMRTRVNTSHACKSHVQTFIMISSSGLVRLDQHFDQRPVTLLSTQALICFVQQQHSHCRKK